MAHDHTHISARRKNDMGLLHKMADDVAREIDGKTREFYEFVLPPIDMVTKGDSIVITADMPGFEKKDIDVTLRGRMLRIQACKEKEAWLDAGDKKEKDGDEDHTIHYAQRPSFIDKKIRLPVPVHGSPKPWEEEEGKEKSPAPAAEYRDGMLVVSIPIKKGTGRNIPIG